MSNPSLWWRMLKLLEASAEAVRQVFERRSGTDSVAFSIAFIALAAKLAKADGTVTRDEVAMFRRIFEIPPGEEANAARVYNLCRQDVTGYEAYARQMHRALGDSGADCCIRAAVLDGLFHIAMADGEYHTNEEFFLHNVADIFGLAEHVFIRLRSQHVPEHHDPWAVLGVEPSADPETLARARRAFLRANHPDKLIADGLPTEMIELANARVAAFNSAYEEVQGMAPAKVRA